MSKLILLIALLFVVSYLNPTFLNFISDLLRTKLGVLGVSLILISLSIIFNIRLKAAAP